MTGFSASCSILSATSVMVETWESACAKLGAEASVDGGAVKCSYLEPALPSAIPALSNVVSKLNVPVPHSGALNAAGTLNAVGEAGVSIRLNESSVATRTEGVKKEDLPPLHVKLQQKA